MNTSTQKTLFQLCYPLFLHSIMGFGVLLVDTMIISAYSDNAAAAVNMANQVLLVAYEFSVLLGVGGVILIAHHLGAGNEEKAKEVASIAIVGNAAFSFIVSIVLMAVGAYTLSWINTPADIYDDALLYIYICGSTLALNGFMLAAQHVLRGYGLTKIIFLLGVFSQIFYLSLEYVFILGIGPIEGMGVFGSALGTVCLRVAATLILFFVVLRKLRLSLVPKMSLAELRALIKKLFLLSFPSISDNMAYGMYQLILLGFIAKMGVATVLSRGYTLIATAFFTVVIMVVSQGNEVLLGYRMGEGKSEEAYQRAIRSAFIAIILATALSVLFYFFSSTFFGLFTDDPEVHRIGRELLYWSIFLQPVFAFNAILFHSLKAVGDVNWPVAVSQSITWFISLPFAYIVAVHMEQGVVGIWKVLIFEESLKSALMFYRWNSKRWHKYSLSLAAQT